MNENRYLVAWLREGHEYGDVVDYATTPQEAVDEVRRIHINANVVAVGLLVDNNEWK